MGAEFGYLTQPALYLLAVVAFVHWRGRRVTAGAGARSARGRVRRWRALSFYAGLVVILIAIDSPIDQVADRLFWMHMTQHVLLLSFAPPLIALGAPWAALARGVPPRPRRALARVFVGAGHNAVLRGAGHALAVPMVVFSLYVGVLWIWHAPALYNLTLANPLIHYSEHMMFLGLGVLLWCQILDSPPFYSRMDDLHRVAFVLGVAVASWLLALVLATWPTPIYSAYASLAHRPGGISALTDQRIGAGVMWGPGSVAYGIFVFVGLYRWLGSDEGAPAPVRVAHGRLAKEA